MADDNAHRASRSDLWTAVFVRHKLTRTGLKSYLVYKEGGQKPQRLPPCIQSDKSPNGQHITPGGTMIRQFNGRTDHNPRPARACAPLLAGNAAVFLNAAPPLDAP